MTPGTFFADVSPLELTGPGTDAWATAALTAQHAVANGPALNGLTALKLDLTSNTQIVQAIVRVRYQGGEVRAMLLSYDGATWTVTTLPSAGVPQVVTVNTTDITTGDGGTVTTGPSGPSGPTGPTGPTGGTPPPIGSIVVPEPSVASMAGLALLGLVAGVRRRAAAPRA